MFNVYTILKILPAHGNKYNFRQGSGQQVVDGSWFLWVI